MLVTCLKRYGSNGEEKEVADEVIRLSRQYGIVTPYTSFLVVEDEKPGTVVIRRTNASDRTISLDRTSPTEMIEPVLKERAMNEVMRDSEFNIKGR